MNRGELLSTLNSTKSSPARPILTLVNGDNTWLISIPRPAGTQGKAFYHILQDPWLGGSAIAGFAWVLRLDHKAKPALSSQQAIEDWIRDVETGVGGQKKDEEQWLDAVLITHFNLDHCHEGTLRAFEPSTKVFAVQDTVATITGWKHFDNVTTVPDFARGEQWPTTPDMPEWLRVFRLQDESGKYPNLHHGMVISTAASGKEEIVLYSPHGVEESIVGAAREANPDASMLAMLHPLHSCGLGAKAKGVDNGLKLVRQNEPKYWVNTHDDKLEYSGLLSYFMDHGRATLEQGLEKEAKEKGIEQKKPNYVVVENGASCILT
ncbi:hypothetical protein CCHL11_06482 [Colletotrichum chlorophyti]|uniref:Metallo-beta-lactamase domain-containing protein n=1 Tax=Colletotrichum chlorophyti TaxID=708187 RepID=A0A1Q8RRS5_9PEZI|nr:hypothetical protein CCHL11_06482 [Colletotrichum chlorophyti]